MRNVNEFSESNKELVILELKLGYNTHDYAKDFTAFDESEWNRLLEYLTGPDGIIDLYATSRVDDSVDLTNIPLSDLSAEGKQPSLSRLMQTSISVNTAPRGASRNRSFPRAALTSTSRLVRETKR